MKKLILSLLLLATVTAAAAEPVWLTDLDAAKARGLATAYVGMMWGGALICDANAPGDWQKDPHAQSTAKHFFAA